MVNPGLCTDEGEIREVLLGLPYMHCPSPSPLVRSKCALMTALFVPSPPKKKPLVLHSSSSSSPQNRGERKSLLLGLLLRHSSLVSAFFGARRMQQETSVGNNVLTVSLPPVSLPPSLFFDCLNAPVSPPPCIFVPPSGSRHAPMPTCRL